MKETKSNPLISVIVPIYNVDIYLKECIESIQNQTYINLEIILVDDGSTDTSGKICDEYAKKDSRIKVIHKKNGGLVSARKSGIRVAKGFYATYVDGDDWIELDMYEKLVNQIKNADVIVSGVMRDYKNYTLYEKNKVSDGDYKGDSLKDNIYNKMIYTGKFYERGIIGHIWNSLYKKDLLLKNQMKISDDIRIAEDIACLYPILLDAEEIVVISECFYHYRMRENSMMGSRDREELWRFELLYEHLQARFSEEEDLKEVLLSQLDYLMIYCLMLKEIRIFQNEEGIFPYQGIKREDKIAVYGAGRFGNELVEYIKNKEDYSLVLWIDEGAKKGNIEKIKDINFDYIIVAVLMQEMAEAIENKLVNMKIPKSKIKVIDMKLIDDMKEKWKKLLMGESKSGIYSNSGLY